MDRRQFQQMLDQSSVGAGMELVRSSPFHCVVRFGPHTVSGAAERAGVPTTRCTSCRARLRLADDGRWRTDDDSAEPDYTKEA